MRSDSTALKLLFIINSGSGNNEKKWQPLIETYFKSTDHHIKFYNLPDSCLPDDINRQIKEFDADRVVAVGGDGTVKLVAQCLHGTHILLGILPAGSANGMAKELQIPEDINKALEIIVSGETKKIHLVKINEELCIHLSDLGFNAFVVKNFESNKGRGMWGYLKASWKALRNKPEIEVKIQTDKTVVFRNATMIVIANATQYGTGALINPDGKLDDDVFEVIIVKKISITEIFKMMVTHSRFNPAKTEIFHTKSLDVHSHRKTHFQVDGEYLGKVNDVHAEIIPAALEIIVPGETENA